MPPSTDPSDPRRLPRGRREWPRFLPADWVPAPPGFSPTEGVPKTDSTIWWRLQPGERGPDGKWIRRGIVHGGTCGRWPSGRTPPGWTYHTKPQVKEMLAQPKDFIPCPLCCRGWLWAIWPTEETGPRAWWPTDER